MSWFRKAVERGATQAVEGYLNSPKFEAQVLAHEYEIDHGEAA